MNKIWIIGDLHFGHKKIIEYCNRPFASIEEMNTKLIENWNKVVKPNDTVFINGDFALMGKNEIISIGNQLNGIKTLILGNHDQASADTYYKAGFKYVSKYPIIVSDFLIISHEPLFINENSPYFNIFAHVHNNPNYKDYSKSGFCTSAERINYTPILLDTIRLQVEKEFYN